MKESNRVKSWITLACVVVVAIGLLGLLNYLFPGYVKNLLDDDTKALIGQFMKAEDYKVYEGKIGGFDSLDDFNNANGENATVRAIYVAVGGQHDGNYIVETASQGYVGNPLLQVLTGYTDENTIIGTRLKFGDENAPSGSQAYDRPGFFDSFDGRGEDIDYNDIMASTGATAASTVRGYVNGVNLATKLVKLLNGGQETPETPTLQDPTQRELTLLQDIYSSSVTYKKADKEYLLFKQAISSDKAENIVALYIASDDTLIYEALGNGGGFGKISLMVIFDTDDTIAGVIVGTQNSAADNPPDNSSTDLIADALRQFVGKDYDQIKNMGVGDLDGNSGATETAQGILLAAINTFEMKQNLSIDLV